MKLICSMGIGTGMNPTIDTLSFAWWIHVHVNNHTAHDMLLLFLPFFTETLMHTDTEYESLSWDPAQDTPNMRTLDS